MAQQLLSFRDLRVYQEMFALQQDVFQLSKDWPKDERYALTDQIRRSSRSMGSNIAEAWAKRRYPSHFASKLTDSDGELQETAHWLSTALACEYLTHSQWANFQIRIEIIGRRLGKMISKSETFCPSSED
jgi:four helix bundle protein